MLSTLAPMQYDRLAESFIGRKWISLADDDEPDNRPMVYVFGRRFGLECVRQECRTVGIIRSSGRVSERLTYPGGCAANCFVHRLLQRHLVS
jgi:hypothetical protein